MTTRPRKSSASRAAPSRPDPFQPVRAALRARLGQEWFETGCLSAHYRNPVFEGEEVQASIEIPKPGQRIYAVGMTRKDGAEILRGTASLGGDGSETALSQRLKELKPLTDPVILADIKPGMKTTRQTIRMDADQHMGDLYPFSLNEKLKVITEPSPWYASGDNPGAGRSCRSKC